MNGSFLLKAEQMARRQMDQVDWLPVGENLDARGFAVIGGLLSTQECRTIASLYPDDANFRSQGS
jgi:uncharacterized protein